MGRRRQLFVGCLAGFRLTRVRRGEASTDKVVGLASGVEILQRFGRASCNGDDRGVELCMGPLCGVVCLERGMFCLSWVSCRVLLDAPSDARVRFVTVSSGHEDLRLKQARGEGFYAQSKHHILFLTSTPPSIFNRYCFQAGNCHES
jgi:hypothetical protein